MPPVEEQTPAAETTTAVETPKPQETEVQAPTLKETEAEWREDQIKERGLDASKFGVKKEEAKVEETKKEEPKVEAKKEEPKAEEKKEEPKVEVKKATTGFGKLIKRAVDKATSAQQAKIDLLQSEIANLKGTPATKAVETTVALVEPQRKDFPNVEDWVVAVRAYDKAVAEEDKKATTSEKEVEKVNAQWQAKVEKYNTALVEAKKKYPDWTAKQDAASSIGRQDDEEYNNLMVAVLMDAGPDTIYQLASKPAEAKQLSKLDQHGLIAATHSDDLPAVLLWLAGHPEDIRVINGLNPVKAQAYVGRIEERIAKAASASTKEEPKVESTKRTPTGETATPPKPEEKGGDTTGETGRKAKPEPPPALRGTAPSNAKYSDPVDMSLAERERLYREDPRNKRR